MPLIQVKLIEEVFTAAQKKEIITKLTDAMVAVEGENMRSVTWVIIEDVRSGEWGIGGQALTTDQVRAIAAAIFLIAPGGQTYASSSGSFGQPLGGEFCRAQRRAGFAPRNPSR